MVNNNKALVETQASERVQHSSNSLILSYIVFVHAADRRVVLV